MAARVQIGDKFYRRRRGRLVEIPPEWVGQVTDAQTIRKRPSKTIHKLRKEVRLGDMNIRRRKALERLSDERSV